MLKDQQDQLDESENQAGEYGLHAQAAFTQKRFCVVEFPHVDTFAASHTRTVYVANQYVCVCMNTKLRT